MFRKHILPILALSSLAFIGPNARGQGAVIPYSMLSRQITLTARISDVFLALSAAKRIPTLSVNRDLLGMPGIPDPGYRPGIVRIEREIELLLRFRGGEPRLIAAILGDLPPGLVFRLEALALGGNSELATLLLDAKGWLNDSRLLDRIIHLKRYIHARASGAAFLGWTEAEVFAARATDSALIHEFFRGNTDALRELSSVGYEALRKAVSIQSKNQESMQMSALPAVDDIMTSYARRNDLSARAEYLNSVLALIERTLRPYTVMDAFIDPMSIPEGSFLPNHDLKIDIDVYARFVDLVRVACSNLLKTLAAETYGSPASGSALRLHVSDHTLIGDPNDHFDGIEIRHAAIMEFLEVYAERSPDPAYRQVLKSRQALDAR